MNQSPNKLAPIMAAPSDVANAISDPSHCLVCVRLLEMDEASQFPINIIAKNAKTNKLRSDTQPTQNYKNHAPLTIKASYCNTVNCYRLSQIRRPHDWRKSNY